MQPKFIVDEPKSKYIDQAKPPNPPSVSKSRKRDRDVENTQDEIFFNNLIESIDDDLVRPNLVRRFFTKFKKWIILAMLLLAGTVSVSGLSGYLDLF